jgi:hypothetical protein
MDESIDGENHASMLVTYIFMYIYRSIDVLHPLLRLFQISSKNLTERHSALKTLGYIQIFDVCHNYIIILR